MKDLDIIRIVVCSQFSSEAKFQLINLISQPALILSELPVPVVDGAAEVSCAARFRYRTGCE